MNQSLALLAFVILVGACLIAYLSGFGAGKSEGHETGKKEGKKEKSMRAFAVGYDRGKRDGEQKSVNGTVQPSWSILFLLAVLTVVVLTILKTISNR